MSVFNVIERQCVQTAVYWGNPVNDGYGHMVFDDPIEILCRWEDKKEMFLDSNGEQLVSKAVIYTTQIVETEGVLFLGEIDSLDSAEAIDPLLVLDAQVIKRIDKNPGLRSSTEFLLKVYLHNYGGL